MASLTDGLGVAGFLLMGKDFTTGKRVPIDAYRQFTLVDPGEPWWVVTILEWK